MDDHEVDQSMLGFACYFHHLLPRSDPIATCERHRKCIEDEPNATEHTGAEHRQASSDKCMTLSSDEDWAPTCPGIAKANAVATAVRSEQKKDEG